MRRDTFLRSIIALAAAGVLPLVGLRGRGEPEDDDPGATRRRLGTAPAARSARRCRKAGAGSVTTTTRAAAGAIGLAQFVNASKGRPQRADDDGRGDGRRIITGKPPVNLSRPRRWRALISEYRFVLPAESPLKSMKEVIEQMKKDPGSVKVGRFARLHRSIAAAMIAREVGADPSKINYVAFRGGGEAAAAVLGGHVTVGGSGWFGELHRDQEDAPDRGEPRRRVRRASDVPTLKEQGLNVEIGNWRGVYGAPASAPSSARRSPSWSSRHHQTKAGRGGAGKNAGRRWLLTGPEFTPSLNEFASLRADGPRPG